MRRPYSLGAALRVCRQAEAMSPAREWRLLDRVTIDRSRPGQQILVRMDGIPATDSRGRIAHVRGLYVHASQNFVIDINANDPVPAYQLRSLWPSTFLRDFTGWNYFADLDARTFLDDQFFRWGSHVQWPAIQSGIQSIALAANFAVPPSVVTGDAGIPVNLGIPSYDADVSFYMPFTGPSRHPLRGLIPLASLQRVSNNALTIRVGTGITGTYNGVTPNGLQVIDPIDGVTREGCDVWADIVWLSGLVVDAPWQLDEYTLTELTGVLAYPERTTQYAWIRFFPEDDPINGLGQELVSVHDGITVTTAGFTQKSGQRIDDAVTDMFLDEMSRWAGSGARSNAAQSLPLATELQGPLALSLLPFRQRQQAAAGPVSYRYETRGQQPWTRYVHRTVAPHTAERGKSIEQRLNAGPCSIVSTDYEGKPARKMDSYEPVIMSPTRGPRMR